MKKYLMTTISNIRHNQTMSKTSNTELQSVKLLAIIKL